jgi:serine phosphatase RsbU (regulator of sigma subunit)
MEVQIGVAKTNKYAQSESGDTLEVIERPHGGLSVVLADGQRSGKHAKRISNMVVRKVIQLLAEGVRDGAAARAASDYLYAHKSGQVQSTLNILSIDLDSNTLVITRNNPAPMLIFQDNQPELLDEESISVGVHRGTRPVIRELPLSSGLTAIAYSDGILHAGSRSAKTMDPTQIVADLLPQNPNAQQIADVLLNQALTLDEHRPVDDISVMVVRVSPLVSASAIRRMTVSLPL